MIGARRSLFLGALIAASACGSGGSADIGSNATTTTNTTVTAAPGTFGVVAANDVPASPVADPDIESAIRQIVSEWYGPSEIGGVVAVVATPDGTLHTATIGEAAPGTPARADDIVRIGSITKTYTAAITLRLASRGLIDLDAPVSEYVTALDLDPRVTVRSLLDHTSGIADPRGEDLIAAFVADPAHRYTTDELVALAQLDTAAEIGRFDYANVNYHLAGLVIEHVTGHDFTTVLNDEILEPLGLDHTHLVGFEPGDVAVVPGNADLDGDGTADTLAETPYLAVDTYGWTAGAIATTPADLVSFVTALFDGALLDHDAVSSLTTTDGDGYAMGLVSVGLSRWGHNGGAPGYHAVFVHQPDAGTTAALFTNCPACATGTPDTWQIVGQLLDLAAP